MNTRYWVNIASVGITPPGNTSSTTVTGSTYTMVVDSGSTLCQWPAPLFNALLAYFPDAVNAGNGAYTVPCSYRSQAGTIDFGFQSTTTPIIIHVPYHEWFYFDGTQCYFGASLGGTSWTLGGKILNFTLAIQENNC